ncbi:MAG: hypothetical protein ACPGXY_04860, partial [Alphaproteobacteria bacterium]
MRYLFFIVFSLLSISSTYACKHIPDDFNLLDHASELANGRLQYSAVVGQILTNDEESFFDHKFEFAQLVNEKTFSDFKNAFCERSHNSNKRETLEKYEKFDKLHYINSARNTTQHTFYFWQFVTNSIRFIMNQEEDHSSLIQKLVCEIHYSYADVLAEAKEAEGSKVHGYFMDELLTHMIVEDTLRLYCNRMGYEKVRFPRGLYPEGFKQDKEIKSEDYHYLLMGVKYHETKQGKRSVLKPDMAENVDSVSVYREANLGIDRSEGDSNKYLIQDEIGKFFEHGERSIFGIFLMKVLKETMKNQSLDPRLKGFVEKLHVGAVTVPINKLYSSYISSLHQPTTKSNKQP